MSEDSIIYTLNPHARIRLKGKTIARKKSQYQDVVVFESEMLGRTMLIGVEDYLVVQFSLRDEMHYHEGLVHPPMALHPGPKKVLVIGGGDGGTIREVLKHPVEKVVLAELDAGVIDIVKEYFPSVPNGAFEDPRLEVKIGDGKKYLEETDEKFDVVILDLTDPEGPSKMLFTREFYALVKSKMNEGGTLSVQTGSPYFEGKVSGRVHAALKEVFKNTVTYGNFVQSFFIVESYTLATDSPISGIAQRLKERNILLKAYTPEEIEHFVLNPSSYIKETLSKGWEPSTDADPVDIAEVRDPYLQKDKLEKQHNTKK